MKGLDELRKELEHVKECLLDLEDTHSFDMKNTSCHVGSGTFTMLQEEFEEKRGQYRAKISELEGLIRRVEGR